MSDDSPDDHEDPFDDLDDHGDREGDPFDHLDGPDPGAPGEGDAGGTDDVSTSEDSETEADDRHMSDDGRAEVDDRHAGEIDRDQPVDVTGDPLGDVDVSRGDPFEGADSPFQQVDVSRADPDEVWEQFVDEGSGAAETAATEAPEEDVVVVSKHRFCEGCPHVTPPPDVRCTHEGTRILEFVGPDDVRVSNCPIVRERRELGEVHERE